MSLWYVIQEVYQRSGSCHCGMLYKRFIKGVVLVIVICYTRGLSKEWFLSLWYVIQEVFQRSGSCHCGMLYKRFFKGVVLVIVVCYTRGLSLCFIKKNGQRRYKYHVLGRDRLYFIKKKKKKKK